LAHNDAYEAEHDTMDAPDPIKFRVQQRGLTRKYLEPMIERGRGQASVFACYVALAGRSNGNLGRIARSLTRRLVGAQGLEPWTR
jgi:hypothetical protein